MVTPPTPSKPARRFLRFSLRTFLLVTLALSLALGIFGRVWLKAYRDSQPPTLYELAQIAKRHGIPMPPKGAKLVLAIDTHRSSDEGQVYSPAFLLERFDDGRVLVLRGAERETLEPGELGAGIPLVRDFSLEPTRSYFVICETPASFECAAQLADRGDAATAKAIFDYFVGSQGERMKRGYEATGTPHGLRNLMAHCAYTNMARRLRAGPNDWSKIREELESLFAEFPKVANDYEEVLTDLEAALDAPSPAPDSVEALLLDWSQRPRETWSRGVCFTSAFAGDPEYAADAAARKIVVRGFDAVPELLRLCSDSRLSAQWSPIRSRNRDKFLRVGELADDLLQEIAGWGSGEPLVSSEVDDSSSPHLSNWRNKNWWNQTIAAGEANHFVATFYSLASRTFIVNECSAYVLSQKYPHRLPDVVRNLSAVPVRLGDIGGLAEATAGSNLASSARTELLSELASRGVGRDKLEVLIAWSKFDETTCAKFTVQALAELPADTDRRYDGCPEAEITILVILHSDQRVWIAFLDACRRASVGLRMELLNPIDHWPPKERQRRLRLALLAAFLNDEAIRDVDVDPDKFVLCSASDLPQIAVRDFVARNLASMLDIEAAPDPSWTPAQWSALREQVRERLKGEELPALE